MKYLAILAKILLAIPMIVFGLNKFFWFMQAAPPPDPLAQSFLGSMFSSYLGYAVGFFEVLGGILLLLPRTSFVGLLLLAPLIFNIATFHFAHDFIGNGIWILPSLLFLLLCFVHKEKFSQLLKA